MDLLAAFQRMIIIVTLQLIVLELCSIHEAILMLHHI